MQQTILIIGGSGGWSSETYLPAILSMDRKTIKLKAIADIVDPYVSKHTKIYCKELKQHNVRWVKLTNDKLLDNQELNKFIQKNNVDTLIISSPPDSHLNYIEYGLKNGLDIICDKPIIAYQNQSSFGEKAERVYSDYNYLIELLENSVHKRHKRKCIVLLPLRRRIQSLYTIIYNGLKQVRDFTGQNITHLYINTNDGCHRYGYEFDLPGAHSYNKGMGVITHTGYHIIDMAAACISNGINEVNRIKCRVTNCNDVENYIDTRIGEPLAKILQREYDDSFPSKESLKSEIDINVQYLISTDKSEKYQSDVSLSIIHAGCSRRINPYYPKDCTHDEGRVDDSLLMIQQGALQSFHFMISADSSHNGPIGNAWLVRRLHPVLADKFNLRERTTIELDLTTEKNVKEIIKDFLLYFDNSDLGDIYEPVKLENQGLTTILYALALISKSTQESILWEKEI